MLELLAPVEHRAAVMVSGARRAVDVSLVEEEGHAPAADLEAELASAFAGHAAQRGAQRADVEGVDAVQAAPDGFTVLAESSGSPVAT